MTDPVNTPRLIVDKSNLPERTEPNWPDQPDDRTLPGTPRLTDQRASAGPGAVRLFLRTFVQIILVAVVLFGAKKGYDHLLATKPEGSKRPPREQVYTVNMATVDVADHQPTFTVYGNTVAGDTVDLRVLVSGEIVELHSEFQAGHSVNAGDVLVRVDSFEYEGALKEAQANLQEAQARLSEIEAKVGYEKAGITRARVQLEIAERDLQRSKDLLERGSGTQKTVDDKELATLERAQSLEQRSSNLKIEEARIEQQKAAITRLEWKVSQAERDLENTRLRASFDAVISSADAGLGRNVSANDVVVSLYQRDSLEVRFVVTDAQYGRLLSDSQGVVNRPVTVTWTVGGEPIEMKGHIERVGAELQSERGGVELFAVLDLETTDFDVRPGAFVEIDVPDKVYTSSVLLPETSVYKGNRVYVIEDDRLVARTVKAESYTGGNVIITEGLAAGERVLTTQIADARDGLKVIEEGATPKRGKPADKDKPPAAAGAKGDEAPKKPAKET